MLTADRQPSALFLMGPTACGKTELALELVQRFPFEIISVDSALVYRGMDIGTAKPDFEIRHRAPHWLVDILDPAEIYSAARFCHDARQAMEQIRQRGRVPLLVGGTMLYFRALQQGLANLPRADPETRKRLQEECSNVGTEAMHARLAVVDPLAAARIHPRDPQRIQRALEVYELTGRAITELYDRQQDEKEKMQIHKLAIVPSDRIELHRRIERRFKQMLDAGFVDEVIQLKARPDLGLDKPSMRAVGYRQVWAYLEGASNYEQMKEQSITATRQLAKRQLTWLRSEADAIRMDAWEQQLPKQVLAFVQQCYSLPK